MTTNILPIPLPVVTSYDPNWYLSTIVQSTAAFIAIVGGFLISRLVAMSSEKNSLISRLSQAQGRKNVLQNRLDDVVTLINRRAMGWFQNDALDSVIDNPKMTVEDLCDKFKSPGEISTSKQTLAGLMLGRSQHFHDLFEEKYPGFMTIPTELAEFRSDDVTMESALDEDLAVGIAQKLNKRRENEERIQKREAAKRNQSPLSRVMSNFGFDDEALLKTIQARNSLVSSFQPSSLRIPLSQKDELDLESDLDSQIIAQNAEIKIYEDQISTFAVPTGLVHGFLVLAYFGIVGVLVPLYQMSKNPVALHGSGRILVLVLFTSGFIWLLGYIGKSIRDMVYKGAFRDSPPKPPQTPPNLIR